MSRFAKQLLMVLALIGLLVAAFVYTQLETDSDVDGDGMATSTQDSVDLPGGGLGISYDLEPEEPAPEIGGVFVQRAGVSDDVFAIAQEAIKEIDVKLADEPFNYDLWVDLGNYRNFLKDFDRAEEAWEYATYIRPTQSTAYINLGTLYERERKDVVKAEEYYLKALEFAPEQISSYVRLFELYSLSFEQKRDRADDILIEGLEQIPNDLGVLVKLARFLVKEGDFEGAREYYGRAIDVAKEQERSDSVQQLISERDRVPR
ncbi:MAG: hypothetical protein Q8P93_02560 [bacterium]|nr:hypothetical protein [bacterium]